MGEKEEQLLHQFREESGADVYDKARHEWVVSTWLTTIDEMAACMAEKFGWDAVNGQLKAYWEKRAMERLPHGVARATAHGEPRDCVTLGKTLVSARLGYSVHQFLEISPQRLHWVKRGCDEAVILKETGLMGKLYWPCTTLWSRKAAELLNPKIQITYLKSECEGDDCCERIYTLNE